MFGYACSSICGTVVNTTKRFLHCVGGFIYCRDSSITTPRQDQGVYMPDMNIANGNPLYLRDVDQCRTIELGNINGVVRFQQSGNGEDSDGRLSVDPAMTIFRCGNIGRAGTCDLGQCTNLRDVRVGNILGTINLHSRVTVFECGDIGINGYNTPACRIDLSQCTNLTRVTMGRIGPATNIIFSSTATQSSGVTEFRCGNVYGSLDFRQCLDLEGITMGGIYNRNITLPSSLIHFESGNLQYVYDFPDFRHCTQLRSIRMRTIRGIYGYEDMPVGFFRGLLPPNVRVEFDYNFDVREDVTLPDW